MYDGIGRLVIWTLETELVLVKEVLTGSLKRSTRKILHVCTDCMAKEATFCQNKSQYVSIMFQVCSHVEEGLCAHPGTADQTYSWSLMSI